MQARLVRRAVFGAAGAAAVLLSGVAQAALQDRDLNGDAVVDAFYDTDLNITWLRDANVNGLMNWDAAVSWAGTYSFGGYTDWRLPTSDTCTGHHCTSSEMGHLWYIELGNSPGPMTNPGKFQNLQKPTTDPNYYWSGTEWAPNPLNAWNFTFGGGGQYGNYKGNLGYALAVRPGDVAAVPEPQTYALFLAGLALVGAVAPRRRT